MRKASVCLVHTVEVNGNQNSLITNIQKHIFPVTQKREMYAGLVWHEGEGQNVHFWVNYVGVY